MSGKLLVLVLVLAVGLPLALAKPCREFTAADCPPDRCEVQTDGKCHNKPTTPQDTVFHTNDIVQEITQHLNPASVHHMTQVSKQIHTIAQKRLSQEIKPKADLVLSKLKSSELRFAKKILEQEPRGGLYSTDTKIKAVPLKETQYGVFVSTSGVNLKIFLQSLNYKLTAPNTFDPKRPGFLDALSRWQRIGLLSGQSDVINKMKQHWDESHPVGTNLKFQSNQQIVWELQDTTNQITLITTTDEKRFLVLYEREWPAEKKWQKWASLDDLPSEIDAVAFIHICWAADDQPFIQFTERGLRLLGLLPAGEF